MAVSDEGALRLAQAALRTNGGCEVVLRLPGLAVNGSDAEQLGLATPQFQDVPIGPATWRKLGGNTSLLVGAARVAELVGSQGYASAKNLFEAAVGIVADDVLYRIGSCEPLVVSGRACAYRVAVKGPAWV